MSKVALYMPLLTIESGRRVLMAFSDRVQGCYLQACLNEASVFGADSPFEGVDRKTALIAGDKYGNEFQIVTVKG